MTTSSPVREHSLDTGRALAGYAVAVRREQLGLTQRDLSDDKTISQSVLVAFERGRSWPRESTRTKLERRLQWPRGTLELIRTGAISAFDLSAVPAGNNETAIQIALTVEAAQIALEHITARIASLPNPDEPHFTTASSPLLADLRRVCDTTAHVAQHHCANATAMLTVSDIRSTYHELMMLCAHADGATLGQRLYAFRYHAKLTVDETALAAGVPASCVIAAEAGQPIAARYTSALELLILSHTTPR